MFRKLMALLAIGACLVPARSVAQATFTLSGRVADNTRHPLEFAIAALHSLPDSSLVKAANTDSAGTFSFAQLKAGNYYVDVSMLGYIPYRSAAIDVSDARPAIELPAITLGNDAKGLKEVSVVAKKAFVVRKADRTVVNVDAVLTAAGTTALEMLEKCPGVQINQDGGITLKGKQGVTVFINDKPSYMSGDQLTAYLKSLPSSTLDQIELMTNPPAQYDAAGNGGIINIKIKRKGVKGFNGGLNLSYTQGQLTRSNNSLNLNYRNNKVSGYCNLGYNLNNNFTDLDLNRVYKDAANNPLSYFNQKSYAKRHGDAATLNAGADYNYSDKTTIGITLSGMARMGASTNDNTSRLLNTAQELDSVIVARNHNDTKYSNGGINLNYRTQFNTSGHGLTGDADYIAYGNTAEQVFNNDSYLPGGAVKSKDILTGYLPSHIGIYSLKTDYSLPMSSRWKMDAGLKASYTETNNKAEYSITSNNTTQPDYNKSNQFIYKENINAAYLNFSKEGVKLSIQAGLRVENTLSDGHQLGNLQKPDSAFTRNYTSAFPTLYLSYKFDTLAKNQLGINYGRRIDRPYYEDLNPFINPMDKFTYYVGNPFLRPSYSNGVELSYTYNNKISAGLSYSKSTNDVNETIEIQNGIYYSRPGNIGSKTTITLSVDGDFDPAKWLNLHVYTEVGNIASKSNFYTGTLNTAGTYWFGTLTARFTLGKGWDAELNGNYRTKITDAQFIISGLGQANMGIQKKLSPVASLKANVSDIFYTRVVYGEIGSLSQASANWINRSDSRFATLTFVYRFGQAFRNTDRHTTGADAEQKRVKG